MDTQRTLTFTVDEFGERLSVMYSPPPVAIRYNFDGNGWQYCDCGNGSDWEVRAEVFEDAEGLFPASRLYDLMQDLGSAWAALPMHIRAQSSQSVAVGVRLLRSVHDDNVTYLKRVRETVGGVKALQNIQSLREFIAEGLENAVDNGYMPDVQDPLAEAGKMFIGDADVERLTMELLAHFVKLEMQALMEKCPELKQTQTQAQTPAEPPEGGIVDG